MSVAVVTGSAGLVGAAVTRLLANEGFDVIGIDNDIGSNPHSKREKDQNQRDVVSNPHRVE